MSAVFSVLSMAWGFFSSIQCPFLNISFASLFLGAFVINFSIRLLKPLLGLGSRSQSAAERFVSRSRYSKGGDSDS